MSDWLYLPITIHYVNTMLVNATSGTFIYNTFTGAYNIITISSISTPSSYSYSFTTSDLVKSSSIGWLPLVLEGERPINQHSNDLGFSSFLNDRLYSDGFEFIPAGTNNLAVLMFGLGSTLEGFFSLINFAKMIPFKPISAKAVSVPSKFVISCCPFSLTNVAVFIDYKARGSINYKINESGYLSDCRYLDNIMGGFVTLEENHTDRIERSLGLIAGYLKKNNGDGNLTAIISWDAIMSLIDCPLFGELETTSKEAINPSDTASKKKNNLFKSIVRISVETHDDQSFWGSGVVISKDCIITNEHVMKLDKMRSFTITVPGYSKAKITQDNVIISKCPVKGYDLCFLWVNFECKILKPVKRCISFGSQNKSLRPGAYVQSLGYGLFYLKGKSEVRPVQSEGHFNKLVPSDIGFGRQEIALIIASAGCWNGSSGGGIFNADGELVGIMTSNGKLSDGEIISDFTLVIPITVIEKCIFMLNNNYQIDATEKIKDLWHLKNNHTPYMITPAGLRNSKL
ncbi:Plasminogen [Wickerhamomyces ciferrii]|uniref:Plasminogen n=1 Tax=Wickerhamomyces ciferrii (strain ATCC 14091 / BCRC 22168 / CBS 111 / JCM 3599 / NBRC 0793 / NRRL Y-1031 F-60-10) TaxID=1206466 RepID=K0KD14_WICCF|nr:Plasminogen [Wickerhamomyces ciferrii]CCH42995.1 Plasminogen [Wickerhamomyces ciferrii]